MFVENGRTREHSTPKGSYKIGKHYFYKHIIPLELKRMIEKMTTKRPHSGQMFVENGRIGEHSTLSGSYNNTNIIFYKHIIPLE